MTTTRVSERGQVVIPKAIRDRLGITRGTVLEVEEDKGEIRLRPMGRKTAHKKIRDWREWEGILYGTNALQELEEEHRREIERDERR